MKRTLTYDEMLKIFLDAGFEERPGKGDHTVVRNPETKRWVVLSPKETSLKEIRDRAKKAGVEKAFTEFFPSKKQANGSVSNTSSAQQINEENIEDTEETFSDVWEKPQSRNPLLALRIEDIAYWLLGSSKVEEKLKEILATPNNGIEQKQSQLESLLIRQIFEGYRRYQLYDKKLQEDKDIDTEEYFKISRRIDYVRKKIDENDAFRKLYSKLGAFLSSRPQIGKAGDDFCRYMEHLDGEEDKRILLSIAVLFGLL